MTRKLSADELFHFTQFERLLGIIKNGFYPRYNLEYTYLGTLHQYIPHAIESIPMVCFCDIPFDMVHEHINKYGNCAIGLSKEWGERYGLNPVIYVQPNSIISDGYAHIANGLREYQLFKKQNGAELDDQVNKLVSAVSIGFRQLAYFLKQYEHPEDGWLFNGKDYFEVNKGRFYDEKEWRYVPPNSVEEMWIIEAETLHNAEALHQAHTKLEKYALKFDLSDIKFIVYDTQEQKEKLTQVLCDRYKIEANTVLESISFRPVNELNNL